MSTIASPRQPPPQHHPQPPSSPITSSARSSLSLDRTTLTSTSTRRKDRTALRDYYNLPTPTATSPTSSSSNLPNTSNSTRTPSPSASTSHSLLAPLDAPGFNPQEYVESLLRTSGLEEVLRVESALIGEIRGADGERKALVYDNYSKLIKATETIRCMRVKMEGEGEGAGGGGVGGLGIGGAGGGGGGGAKGQSEIWGPSSGVLGSGKVDTRGGGEGVNVRARVGPMVDRIAEVAGLVAVGGVDGNAEKEGSSQEDGQRTTKAADRRTPPTAQQKATVRWVLSAPSRLEVLISDGRREDAEKEWGRVRSILENWDDVDGVKDVWRQCENIVQEADKEEG